MIPQTPVQDPDAIAKKFGGTATADDIAKKYGGVSVTLANPLTGDTAAQQSALDAKAARQTYNPQHAAAGEEAGLTPTPGQDPRARIGGLAVEFAKGIFDPVALVKAIGHPIESAKGIVQAHQDQRAKGADAFARGNYTEAAAHYVSALVPILGPSVATAAEDIGSGDAKRVAHGLGLVTGLLGPVAAKSAPKGVAVRPPANPNPAARAAVAFGQREGIPVDAATATGSPVLRGVQELADHSMGGAIIAPRANQAAGEALAAAGERLAARAHPTAQTGYQAGEAVLGDINATINRLHGEANTAYSALRKIETNRPGAMGGGGIPVDLRAVKTALAPVLERMRRSMPVTQQDASKGLLAIKNLVEGPDFATASIVDGDLSVIKSIARADNPALRDVSQGLAAKAVAELDRAVTDAVTTVGGPDAIAALRAGRAATKAKYDAAGVLETLRDEPVQAFAQATWAKDAGIDRLRAVQRLAPQQMPKIGRAYLDGLLETATAEGGFGHGAKLFAEWEKLGPQTKQVIFGQTPGLTDALDQFFLLGKKMGERANPSGSALVGATGAGLVGIAASPVWGTLTQIGLGATSKLMHSPAGVRLLTRGFTLPVQSPAAIAAWSKQVADAARAGEKDKK